MGWRSPQLYRGEFGSSAEIHSCHERDFDDTQALLCCLAPRTKAKGMIPSITGSVARMPRNASTLADDFL